MYTDYVSLMKEQTDLEETNSLHADTKKKYADARKRVLDLERSNRLLNDELEKSEAEVDHLRRTSRSASVPMYYRFPRPVI
jgi:hypothetical protein